MSLLKTAIIAIVTASAVWTGSVAWAQGKDDPSSDPVEDPNVVWREYLSLPDDPFLVRGTGRNEPAWVKFTVVPQADGSQRIRFQDGNRYPFHYKFAVEQLDAFAGMTTDQFDHATLYREGRKAVLGAVVVPSIWSLAVQPAEYGIQLVGRDPFTREEVVQIFELIVKAIRTQEPRKAFYFPTYEQQAAAEAHRAWLEEQGIVISSADRWSDGNTVYSPGWALGVLKYVEGGSIRDAYVKGELGPGDILLTDGVPAETPYLAGIITLSASTPNSHVAILAKTTGVPFAHLVIAEDVSRAQELIGHRICLRAYDLYGSTDVRLIDTEGVLDDSMVQEILALKAPASLDVSPVTSFGSYGSAADMLMPSDIRYFGGKAANFGMLRRAIPGNSPVAAALSFDLWTEFMAQTMPDGHRVRESIAARLSSFSYLPSDVAALSAALAQIRDLIEDSRELDFTDAQKQTVLSILQDPQYGFDPSKNLRFRSSTNVEDGREFTGAGLYESYSGCLADDLDGGGSGPCLCDPSRAKERGVFTAIRKVFASFYNENAYLERLRHGIDETQVGMAMLVHHSFPDEAELANGVAVVTQSSKESWEISLVTQAGAVSVTNPEDGSIPEEVTVSVYSFGMYAYKVRQSNLVQLGATVMDWEDDYHALAELLIQVGEEFALTTSRDQFVLEMEYKKMAPNGDLVVKQVREVPQADETPSIVPFLVKEPTRYTVPQGEFGEVFGVHRLKSQWQLETLSLRLTPESLSECLYGPASLEYMADGVLGTLEDPLSEWPGAVHSYTAPDPNPGELPDTPVVNTGSTQISGATIDEWRMDDLQNPRVYRLQTSNIPTLVSASESAVLTLRDFGHLLLEVEYEHPVVQWEWTGVVETTRDQVRLVPAFEPSSGDLLQTRRFEDANGVVIDTTFYWPPAPTGPTAGYTAPLARWVETRIIGYTSEPIVLQGFYSQTYKPEHHNFSEHFLFEPQLEPGLSSEILAELHVKGIRQIHVLAGMDKPTIATYE
ncbi:MAG: PEP/pyruvate-binding domain-containing protein [Phycisphaerales bacterium]